MTEKAFHVSWDQFHRDARALAWRLSGSERFSGMVAITRGGLVPAAIVARELDMRIIDTFCVASYAREKIQGEVKVLKSVMPETARDAGEGLLVIDDLADTARRSNSFVRFCPRRMSRQSMQSHSDVPSWTHLSPRYRRTLGSIFRGTWA